MFIEPNRKSSKACPFRLHGMVIVLLSLRGAKHTNHLCGERVIGAVVALCTTGRRGGIESPLDLIIVVARKLKLLESAKGV